MASVLDGNKKVTHSQSYPDATFNGAAKTEAREVYPKSEHEIEQRARVISEAQRWLGTPFVHGACTLGAGIACGPLLIAVYAAAGVAVPNLGALGHWAFDWHLHSREERYLNMLLEFTREVSSAEPGDVALFKIGRVFSHSAIVVDWPGRVIHTMWRRNTEWADAAKAPLAGRAVKFLRPLGWT